MGYACCKSPFLHVNDRSVAGIANYVSAVLLLVGQRSLPRYDESDPHKSITLLDVIYINNDTAISGEAYACVDAGLVIVISTTA